MKTAIIAVNPLSIENANFERFAETVRSLQARGIIDHAIIVSVMHHALFMFPYSWYVEKKDEIESEILGLVTDKTKSLFEYSPVVVLHADSPHADDIAKTLNDYATKIGAELIVLLDEERGAISRAFVGSVIEAASNVAELPTIVISPESGKINLRHARVFNDEKVAGA